MSNPISYDPLLSHYLARELNERLSGRSCSGLPRFGEELSVVLPLQRGEALRLDLHPTRGWVRLVAYAQEAAGENEILCLGVSCPPDERRLELLLRESARFQIREWRLVVELHTNQWNALLLDEETARILTVLRPREAGGRTLRPAASYSPPPPRARFQGSPGAREEGWERWREILGSIVPAERARELVRHFAYTGALNAPPILGRAGESRDEAALRAAFERWWEIRSLPPASPVILSLPKGPHPYPLPLPGLAAEPSPSLLAAMERAAAGAVVDPRAAERAALLERGRRRLQAAERRAERLRAQLAEAEEAERLRSYGDLLLAHLHQVPRGAPSVRLPDWEGGEVEIPLDPALGPAENAAAWYDRARRHARALEKLPALLAGAEAEARRWEEALRSAEGDGGEELPAWAAAELEREPAHQPGGGHRGGGAGEEESLPYRRYRTSGGLEVRVGRSSKDNDRLTFRFSSPGDVWLHARSVPGSHVILRWPQPEANPPARDLAEAAGLAALYSKARTSGLVAVDWTRRKYVRKPRGAPPGAVIPQRVRTVFVEPDAELEERLRDFTG